MATHPDTARQDALQDILDIAARHGLTAADIAAAMREVAAPAAKSTGIMSRLFTYLGGIFILAGLVVFIGMFWDDMGSAARVLITLGAGFGAYLIALVCLTDERYRRAATPLFLIASLLEPGGLFVMMDEYGHGGDPQLAVMFVCLVMTLQLGLTLLARGLTSLVFVTLFFASFLFATTFDWMGVDEAVIALIVGVSLLCITWAVDHGPHHAIAPFWYFSASIAFLYGVFDLFLEGPLTLVVLGVCAFMVYLSTVARSRALLLVSTLATLGYIGWFTAEYFTDTIGWPLALIILGFVFIGMSALAMRLNRRYIRHPDQPA